MQSKITGLQDLRPGFQMLVGRHTSTEANAINIHVSIKRSELPSFC